MNINEIDTQAVELNVKLADILRRTANALKGEPEPMSEHSWHDLAELAAKQKAALEAVEALSYVKSPDPLIWGSDIRAVINEALEES